MITIYLNGATAEQVAETLGGTIIMHNVTDDSVLLANVEQTVLDQYADLLGVENV
jgi:hypothetical protein